MKHRATSLLLAGTLGLGVGATSLVLVPAVASAATSEASTAEAVGDRVARITQALAGLVSDGSITQEQADEVATTLAEQLPRSGPGGGPRHAPGSRHGGPAPEVAAEVLGTTVEELRTALEGGQSLAGLAEEVGVERQALVDALVEAGTERLTQAVASGRLTQEEADERAAGLAERVAEQVDREGLPARGRHVARPERSAESQGAG